MQADVLTQVVLPSALFIIMFGLGLSLTADDFTRVMKQPKAFAIGMIAQMVLLPVIAYLVVLAFALPPELAVGLMIIAFCPGGVTSNMYSYLARGDVALSISLTAFSSLVAPFTIPLLTYLAMENLLDSSQGFSIPVGKTITQLLAITIVPVVIGIFIHRKWERFANKMETPIKILSVLFLFLIIAGIVAKSWSSMAGFFAQAGLATLILNVVSMTAGFWLAKLASLNREQSITIGFEVGLQNGTMALLVAGTILGNSTMAIPAVTYSLLMFATGALFGWLLHLRHKAPVTVR